MQTQDGYFCDYFQSCQTKFNITPMFTSLYTEIYFKSFIRKHIVMTMY